MQKNPLAIIRHIRADLDPASDLSPSMAQLPLEDGTGNPSVRQQVVNANTLSTQTSVRHLDSAVALLHKMGYTDGINP